MSEYNRSEQIKLIHEAKKRTTINKVKESIDILNGRGEKITFASVALESSVARSTLYRNEEIKQLIESNMEKEDDSVTILKEQIKKLTLENEKLKSLNK